MNSPPRLRWGDVGSRWIALASLLLALVAGCVVLVRLMPQVKDRIWSDWNQRQPPYE
jgi:hypothetical protein